MANCPIIVVQETTQIIENCDGSIELISEIPEITDITVQEDKYCIEFSDGSNQIIAVEDTVFEIISEGIQGPPGPGNLALYPAGETINAYRILYLDGETEKVFKADKNNDMSKFSILGMNNVAVVEDENILIRFSGSIENSGWNWDMETGDLSLYLGTDGQVIQSRPTSGYLLKVGCATSPTSMVLRFKEDITLA